MDSRKIFRALKLSSVIILLLGLSGCATPYAEYFHIRQGVIETSPDMSDQFFVGRVTIGETPGALALPVILDDEEVRAALNENLARYHLLSGVPDTGLYQVELDFDFEESGSIDISIRGLGDYLITNIKTGVSTVIHVDETYMAELTGEMYWEGVKSGVIAGVTTVVVSRQLGAGTNTAAAAGLVAMNMSVGHTDRNWTAVALTESERQDMRKIAYAPDDVPLTAFQGEARLERAYEGSIRLNIASFIEKLASVDLP